MDDSVEIKLQDVLGFDENENFTPVTENNNTSTILPKIMSPSKKVLDRIRSRNAFVKSTLLCKTCGFQAENRKQLNKHYYRHMEKTLACDKCPDNCRMCKIKKTTVCMFKTKADLKSHMYMVHTSEADIEWLYCEHCSMRFKKKSGLKNHVSSLHLQLKVACHYCGLLFAVKFINQHIKVIHKNVRYECKACHFPFRTKDGLRQHTIVHHPKETDDLRLLRCPKCSYSTHYKHRLAVHELKKHRHQAIFKCDFCSYKAKGVHVLNMHIYSMHQDKKEGIKVRLYNCKECDYTTHRFYNFEVHKLNHVKPENLCLVECFHCGYKTKRKDNLKVHIFKHDYYRPYIRCYTCHFETKSQAQYVKHIKSNHSKKKGKKLENDSIFNRTQNNNSLIENNQNLMEKRENVAENQLTASADKNEDKFSKNPTKYGLRTRKRFTNVNVNDCLKTTGDKAVVEENIEEPFKEIEKESVSDKNRRKDGKNTEEVTLESIIGDMIEKVNSNIKNDKPKRIQIKKKQEKMNKTRRPVKKTEKIARSNTKK